MYGSIPEALQDDLRPDRLARIVELMVQVREEAAATFSPDAGDDSWSLGCVCYARIKNRIIALSKRVDWLSIENDSLEFVFKIGRIPVRFHRERDQCRRTILGAQPPTAAIQGSFPFFDIRNSHFRLVVVMGENYQVERVDLVRYSGLHITEDCWPLFRRNNTSIIKPLEAPPVELPAPTIKVRQLERKREQDVG